MLGLRKISRILIPLFLLVVVCFLTNTTLNQHYHKLSSGLVIKHAHPFNKENAGQPFQEHQHSSSELILLDQASHIFFRIYLFIIFLIALVATHEIINSKVVLSYRNRDFYFLNNYHAPPEASY
ncbi:MAG: hypothetical protein JXN62_14030 [Bacteroidales bacterium]|nr:hypothetical protein [Bacteroidales bacterium]